MAFRYIFYHRKRRKKKMWISTLVSFSKPQLFLDSPSHTLLLSFFFSLSHLLFTQQNKPNIFSQPFPHTNILTLITFSQFFHHCCCYRIIPCVVLKKRWVVCICMCATMWWITILLANGLSTMYKVLLVLNKLKSIDFDCFGNEVFLGNSITL